MIKIICDRCGEEIPDAGYYGYIALHYREQYDCDSVYGENEFEKWHLCRDCMNEIREFIKFRPAQEKIPVPAAEQPKAGKVNLDNFEAVPVRRRRKVDYGKILALADAGWPVKKIASEMNVSEPTIRNIIRKRDSEQKEG